MLKFLGTGQCLVTVQSLAWLNTAGLPHLEGLTHNSLTRLVGDIKRGEKSNSNAAEPDLLGRGWAWAAGGGERLSASAKSAQVWQTVLEVVWVRKDGCLRGNHRPSHVSERSLPELGARRLLVRQDAGAHFVELKPAWGRALCQMWTCAACWHCYSPHPFFPWFVQSASLLNQQYPVCRFCFLRQ